MAVSRAKAFGVKPPHNLVLPRSLIVRAPVALGSIRGNRRPKTLGAVQA